MPLTVHLMAAGIFAMVTSEFLVAGLMPQIAEGLDVSLSQVGYLVTAFAAAMTLGGPFLAAAVLKLRPKRALTVLFAVFLAGNVLAALAPGYAVMLVARLITGTASAAFLGAAISLSVRLVRPEQAGRAVSVALSGLMLGTLLGLPLSTFVGGLYGWRSAFWVVTAMTVAAAVLTVARVPRMEGQGAGGSGAGGGIRRELSVFRRRRLWLVLTTSTLTIGATFSVFSYVNPILTEVSGFSTGSVPLLLIAYGAANLLGNAVVGRLADRYAFAVLLTGLLSNGVFLAAFALLAGVRAGAVVFLLAIGLVGVTMNPAMATRVQRAGNTGPLLNTVHSSFITLGVLLGSALGGAAIPHFGLVSPAWIGVGLAALGVLTLLPDLRRRPGPSPHRARAALGPGSTGSRPVLPSHEGAAAE
ncbi:MFS transporter [Streptomyces tubbatahanensis]|uniref:MFS transporter n=1 Tax=Streptomyces tubbatahanensis TaxID=2923272 RepID=A0ABY3XT01_9ACTN|nr:MFS transporter [Streptomyces tubbatahanensis]UNS97634.1 MFS transporter [Streptomyces tubbatahanensis]